MARLATRCLRRRCPGQFQVYQAVAHKGFVFHKSCFQKASRLFCISPSERLSACNALPVIDFVRKNELLLGKTLCARLWKPTSDALTRAIDAAMALPPDRLPGAVQHALQASFADGNWLTPAQRQPDPQRYARHVLQADAQGRYTVVALVWQAGQFSPVHAHHTWCALSGGSGELQEHYYACDRQSLRAHAASLAAARRGRGQQRDGRPGPGSSAGQRWRRNGDLRPRVRRGGRARSHRRRPSPRAGLLNPLDCANIEASKHMQTMNHWQRIEAALLGEATDRTPIALWRHFPEDDLDVDKLVRHTLEWQRKWDFDLVKFMPPGTYGVEDWGAATAYQGSANGARAVVAPPVRTTEDWLLDPAAGCEDRAPMAARTRRCAPPREIAARRGAHPANRVQPANHGAQVEYGQAICRPALRAGCA
ncbi:hypothetical protein ACU4HD_17300 [Cupriavidus basilensis]